VPALSTVPQWQPIEENSLPRKYPGQRWPKNRQK